MVEQGYNINMEQEIWVFDIDGVITDPKSKKITHPKILNIIGRRLSNGLKVAFNTGRSAKWLEQKVVGSLRDLIFSDENNYLPLTNLVSVCEMGNVVIKYGTDGEARKKVLNRSIIPDVLFETIKGIVENVYFKSMFVDETKEVILTIEMRDGYSFDKYQKRQEEFRKEISIIMKNYHPHLHVKPSSTTIAIDVKPVDSGKNLGAQKILDWCRSQNEKGSTLSFICFGDSKSDLDMSDYFYLHKLHTEFVYVGSEIDRIKRKYVIHIPVNKFTGGTLEYLSKWDI